MTSDEVRGEKGSLFLEREWAKSFSFLGLACHRECLYHYRKIRAFGMFKKRAHKKQRALGPFRLQCLIVVIS